MKAFLLLVALLLSVTTSFGQVSTKITSTLVLDKPFKGANAIIIAMPDSGLLAWQKLHNTLTQQGFTVRSSDQNQLTLATEPKPSAQIGALALLAEVKGANVMLRGTSHQTDTPAAVEYRGRKDKATLPTWEQLDAFAKSLGGKVEYTRQK